MKAVIFNKYGTPDVLKLKEIDKPIPKNNEVRIRIFATAVNSGDVRLRGANPWVIRLFFGLSKPKISILGSVFSGEIEMIGDEVSKYKVGDPVFGTTGMNLGSYAEYLCLSEDAVLTTKPNNISHQEASTIPFGAMTALYFLRQTDIERGQKILIYGASGAVGTAAVQLANHFGAEVTGVCSDANLELVKSIGALKVIDYKKEDFNNEECEFNVIFVTVDKLSFFEKHTILIERRHLNLRFSKSIANVKGSLDFCFKSSKGNFWCFKTRG